MVSQIYDVLGLVQPFILPARKLLQEISREQKGWNDPLDESQRNAWESYKPYCQSRSLEERVPVRGQVSAPYSSADRTAALHVRILVVREMVWWRHYGLRSACITFVDSTRLRSISVISTIS